VLQLVEIAETRITDEEVQALHKVIGELGDYIRRTTADPVAIGLTRRARMVVGATIPAVITAFVYCRKYLHRCN